MSPTPVDRNSGNLISAHTDSSGCTGILAPTNVTGVANVHPMVTKAKSGIFQPKLFLSTTNQIPT